MTTVEVTESPDFSKKLVRLQAKLRDITKAYAGIALHMAQEQSRVDTGTYKAGWEVIVKDTSFTLHNPVNYSSFVFGKTGSLSAQQFADDIAKQLEPRMNEEYQRAIIDILGE